MIALLLSLALASSPVEQAAALTRGHHAPSAAALRAAARPEVQRALVEVARDPRAPFAARVRALHLAGLGEPRVAEALWAALRRDPALAAEAAWAQGLRRGEAFARGLLRDPRLRVVGERLLRRRRPR